MDVGEQVDELLRYKNPVKKHFNRKWYVGFGAFVVTVLIITLTALPLFDDKSLLSHAQTYLESKTNNNPLVAAQPLNGSAYDYWYAPENSFGMQQRKSVNFTFWRSWLKKYFSYELEARQNNESAWQNANELLNVSLLFNETNNTCKVALTLNTTNAPMSLYYRFTLVANRSVISHVNKSANYTYVLNLNANQTENYSLVYNYSDLAPYIQSGVINIKQGIWNNYFYQRIKTNKKIAVGKLVVIDPIFGDDTEYGTNWQSGDDTLYTNFSKPAYNGTVRNASAFFRSQAAGDTQYAIYFADNLTQVTNGISNSGSYGVEGGNTWHTLTWDAPYPVINTLYNYCLCLATTSDNLKLQIVAVGGDSGWDKNNGVDGLSWPNPLVEDTGYTYISSFYCQYVNISGGLTWQTVNSSINGSAYNTTSWQVVNSSINGSAYNQTAWQTVNSSINGSAYNQTAWKAVNNTINGTAFNSTTWQNISQTINGSAFNTSTVSWQVVNSTINGSAFNLTAFKSVNDSINGSAYNTTAWQQINTTINGSAYNTSITWKTVNNTINGSCYNTSIPDPFNILLEFPINESNIYSIQPTVYFNLTHPDGYTMNYSLYINNATLVYTGANVSNGTQVHTSHLFYSANTTYTDYYWRVVANDGMGNWVNETYNFQAVLQGSFVDTGAGFAVGVAMAAAMLGIGFVFIIRRRRREDEY